MDMIKIRILANEPIVNMKTVDEPITPCNKKQVMMFMLNNMKLTNDIDIDIDLTLVLL
jgi:hypothetical protein